MGKTANKSVVKCHSFVYTVYLAFIVFQCHISQGCYSINSTQSRMTSISSVIPSKDVPYDFCVKGCENCVSHRKVYEGCKDTQEHKLNWMTLDLNGHGLQH